MEISWSRCQIEIMHSRMFTNSMQLFNAIQNESIKEF